jgi:hypothetical protein
MAVVAAYCGSAAVAACCASATATNCCGSVVATASCGPAAAPREPSLTAVAVLTTARDALDERYLVGTTASDLSTLAGARGHGGRHPVNAKTGRLSSCPLK